MEKHILYDDERSHLEYVTENQIERQLDLIKQYAQNLLGHSLTKEFSNDILGSIRNFEDSRTKLLLKSTETGNTLSVNQGKHITEDLQQKVIETIRKNSAKLSCILYDGFDKGDWKTICIDNKDVNLQVKISSVEWDITLFDKTTQKRKRVDAEDDEQRQNEGAKEKERDDNDDDEIVEDSDASTEDVVEKQQQPPQKKSKSAPFKPGPPPVSSIFQRIEKVSITDTEKQQQEKSKSTPLLLSSSSSSNIQESDSDKDIEESSENPKEYTEESLRSPEYDTITTSIQEAVSSLDAGQLMRDLSPTDPKKCVQNCNFSQYFMMRSYTCHSCEKHRNYLTSVGCKVNECSTCWRITCTKCMKDYSIEVGKKGCSACMCNCKCKKCAGNTEKKGPSRCIIERPVRKSWFGDADSIESRNIHVVFFVDKEEWQSKILTRHPTEGVTIDKLKDFLTKENTTMVAPITFDLDGTYNFVCKMGKFKQHAKCFEGLISGYFKITSNGETRVTVRYQAFDNDGLIENDAEGVKVARSIRKRK